MSIRRFRLLIVLLVVFSALGANGCPKEAPQSFEKQNGLLDPAEFDAAREAFEEVETAEDGLGIHFNANSCAVCHFSPVDGGLPAGSGPITELRAGHFMGEDFVPAPGGTLITARALGEVTTEQAALPESEDIRDRFITPSLFGAGFVECIDDATLRKISKDQAGKTGGRISGLVLDVPVLEAQGKKAVGRFGWASQHSSLLSFSADAYKNEMGITSPLEPEDNTFLGQKVDDGVADPEDTGGQFGEDIDLFTKFMRALSAPPRVLPTDRQELSEIEAGDKLFKSIGCAVCHIPEIVTAKSGTLVNAGAFRVPDALGNKKIHPYGDFLLHDIGTGPRIIREGLPAATRGKVRTGALWGLGARLNRGQPLLHDGSSTAIEDAILRHKNSAAQEAEKFQRLNDRDKSRLIKFVRSL